MPRAEVYLILVNGASVGFSHLAADGGVYPEFEAFDITPIHHLGK